MSHFTTIKTQMSDKETLLKALREAGHEPEEGPVAIRGYHGNLTMVDIRIPTSNPDYDIGFRKVKGVYECVADWFGLPDLDKNTFLEPIVQRYACHVARAKLEEQGFALVSEEKGPDGQIHLLARRMN